MNSFKLTIEESFIYIFVKFPYLPHCRIRTKS